MAVQPAVTNGSESDAHKFVATSKCNRIEVEMFTVLDVEFAVTDTLWPIPIGNLFVVEEIEVVGVWVVDNSDVVLVQFLGKCPVQSLDDLHLLVGQF